VLAPPAVPSSPRWHFLRRHDDRRPIRLVRPRHLTFGTAQHADHADRTPDRDRRASDGSARSLEVVNDAYPAATPVRPAERAGITAFSTEKAVHYNTSIFKHLTI
jgi:hypothetical protein